MYPEDIHTPVPIGSAEFFQQSERARVAVAAYLLLAGPLFVEGVARNEDSAIIPPASELREAGIKEKVRGRVALHGRGLLEPGPPESEDPGYGDFESAISNIAELVAEANDTGDPRLAARAVAAGIRSSDELIRVCALGSALEFFAPESLDLPGHIAWLLRHTTQQQTLELLSTLTARVWSPPPGAAGPGSPISRRSRVTGLMAVHGTVLPISQGNRPDWSIPRQGPLFNHLAVLRPDIYSHDDYYRWEGGYTDYAREVAIQSLFDWTDRRRLAGIDVIAHSHGCNVVLGSTMKGAKYGKLILMNCPVHWHKYRLAVSVSASSAVSIRVKLDFVILMDRGGQRFPQGTIPEHVLPIWYTGHSACTKPDVWQAQGLDKYVV